MRFSADVFLQDNKNLESHWNDKRILFFFYWLTYWLIISVSVDYQLNSKRCSCKATCIHSNKERGLKPRKPDSCIILINYQDPSCLLFSCTALCCQSANTALELRFCELPLCLVFWEQGGTFWGFDAALWKCIVLCLPPVLCLPLILIGSGGESNRQMRTRREEPRASVFIPFWIQH